MMSRTDAAGNWTPMTGKGCQHQASQLQVQQRAVHNRTCRLAMFLLVCVLSAFLSHAYSAALLCSTPAKLMEHAVYLAPHAHHGLYRATYILSCRQQLLVTAFLLAQMWSFSAPDIPCGGVVCKDKASCSCSIQNDKCKCFRKLNMLQTSIAQSYICCSAGSNCLSLPLVLLHPHC